MRLTTKCGTPLYAAAFYDSETLVVAGGGGQGAHGVQNKVLVYRVSSRSLEAIAEYELPPNSDSPTGLAIDANRVIWVAVNTINEKTSAVNQLLSLRYVEQEPKLHVLHAYPLFPTNSFSVYPKNVKVANEIVSCASSDASGSLALLNLTTLEQTMVSFDAELVDSAISRLDSRQPQLVAGVMDQEIEFRSVNQPNVRYVPPIPAPKGGRWSRIVSMYPGKFVAAATLGAKAGAQLSVIEIQGFGEAQISHTVLVPNLKGVTALATNGSRIVVASADGGLVVYNALITEPTLVSQLRGVHTLPVTALALVEDGNTVASTSMDGSVVLNDQLDTVVSLRATLGWAMLSAILIMLVGLLITLATFPQLQSTSIGAGLMDIKSRYEEALGYSVSTTSLASQSSESTVTESLASKSMTETISAIIESTMSETVGAIPSATPEAEAASETVIETVSETVNETPEPEAEPEAEPETAASTPTPSDESYETPVVTTPVVPKPRVHEEL